jgi:hypothetical protein
VGSRRLGGPLPRAPTIPSARGGPGRAARVSRSDGCDAEWDAVFYDFWDVQGSGERQEG